MDDWEIDPWSVKFQMLAAYPLLHPVFLAEYTLEGEHITVLAHGYHDYFSVWGHTSHPDEWVNSEQSAFVTYLRATKPIIGGPAAVPNVIADANTPDNLEKITNEVDMNDLRIQPISEAKPTRNWMTLAGKVDELGFLIETIPSSNARIIRIELKPGKRTKKSEMEGDPRAPLKVQLKELEAEMNAAKPEWLVQWEKQNHQE